MILMVSGCSVLACQAQACMTDQPCLFGRLGSRPSSSKTSAASSPPRWSIAVQWSALQPLWSMLLSNSSLTRPRSFSAPWSVTCSDDVNPPYFNFSSPWCSSLPSCHNGRSLFGTTGRAPVEQPSEAVSSSSEELDDSACSRQLLFAISNRRWNLGKHLKTSKRARVRAVFTDQTDWFLLGSTNDCEMSLFHLVKLSDTLAGEPAWSEDW